MAIIKCKMCGGDIELTVEKTFGTCEYCGSTVTLPKIDDEQRAAAFNRGNHFRRSGEFDKALAVYERIVAEDDTDAEAHWCCALCRFGIEYVEDPATYEWLPTCHRASFDSFLEDVDYLAAVEHSDGVTRRQYQRDAVKIAEVQRGILATSQNEEPFDVFICYKETDAAGNRTVDSTLAQDIYYQLTESGYRVFFARITLEDKGGAEYEPYIFAALTSAKIMIAVGTKPEHFNAVWVKNEWSRFLAMMRHDRSKLLLPCYRDMDPYDLPEQLSVLQSYDMSKIGFVQDLLRGIKKVLDADKKPAPVKETVVAQPAAPTYGGNIVALLKRGNMALEDGEWSRADEFFEEVLNQDAECAEAYLGKALAQEKFVTLEDLIKRRLDMSKGAIPQSVIVHDDKRVNAGVKKYSLPGFLHENILQKLYSSKSFSYESIVSSRKRQLDTEQNYWKNNKLLNRALIFAKNTPQSEITAKYEELIAEMNKRLEVALNAEAENKQTAENELKNFLADADSKAEKFYENACAKREALYVEACDLMRNGTDANALFAAEMKFDSLSGYKDSKELAEQCHQRAEEAEKAEEEARLAAEAARLECMYISAREEEIQCKTSDDYFSVAQKYNAIRPYRDSSERAKSCLAKRTEILEEEKRKCAEEWERTRSSLRNKAKKAGNLISMGANHAVAVMVDGTVQYEGGNIDDENEVSTWTEIISISSDSTHTAGLRADGTVVVAGSYASGKCNCSGWKNIVAISVGSNHIVGLKADGTVVAEGFNYDGQCDVRRWKDIVAISAGMDHTVGLKADGTVVATGGNQKMQCAVYGWKDIVGISAGSCFTVGLRVDGTVVTVGDDIFGRCRIPANKNFVSVSAGSFHTAYLQADGTVCAVGNNDYGQCDVSNWRNIVAISAHHSFTMGLRTDGKIMLAGSNEDFAPQISHIVQLWKLFDNIDNIDEERSKAMLERKLRFELRELQNERCKLQTELPTLKGVFSGRRRKEIENRLTELDNHLAEIDANLAGIDKELNF